MFWFPLVSIWARFDDSDLPDRSIDFRAFGCDFTPDVYEDILDTIFLEEASYEVYGVSFSNG